LPKKNKSTRFYIITVVYMLVFYATFYIGVFGNPNFNIYDFFMNLASELVGIVFVVVIVDQYVSLKIARRNEKNRNNANNTPVSTQSGFDIFINEGNGSVKSVSTLKDTQTGVQYLFVVHENGSSLTPLLDKNGKPMTD